MSTLDSPAHIHVSPWLDGLSRMVSNHPAFWIALGNLETQLLALDTEKLHIEKPVFICGLARAGSTILLETLASRPDAVSHRYQDFPFLFTPYWWNTLLKCAPLRDTRKHERAHGDGILINSESPEAMEEMLWMAFFPHLHETDRSEVLDRLVRNVRFESFYREHIAKLLKARGGHRYVSKGNYNVTRMGYLHSLFPDARFIVTIREPVGHIVSLMRQHARFATAGKEKPRIVSHMAQAGHFEFGLNRIPIHSGDTERVTQIENAWENGEEVRGWALYWDMLYRFVYNQLMQDRALAKQVLVLPFEELCEKPKETLDQLFRHSAFPVNVQERDALATNIRTPDYYTHNLSDSDLDMIHAITANTAELFGYEVV